MFGLQARRQLCTQAVYHPAKVCGICAAPAVHRGRLFQARTPFAVRGIRTLPQSRFAFLSCCNHFQRSALQASVRQLRAFARTRSARRQALPLPLRRVCSPLPRSTA